MHTIYSINNKNHDQILISKYKLILIKLKHKI